MEKPAPSSSAATTSAKRDEKHLVAVDEVPMAAEESSLQNDPTGLRVDKPTDPVQAAAQIEDEPKTRISVDLDELSDAGTRQLMSTVGEVRKHGVEGRGLEDRQKLLKRFGGTEASEVAVAKALQWLVEHQSSDGGWNFDHTLGSCDGRCGEPGEWSQARNGATGVALLPFLGAGHQHTEGEFKSTLLKGISYLVMNIKPSHGAGSWYEPEGTMYSHGFAALAVAEAYAMTEDRALLIPAQAALNFIAYAQDVEGGGWRYEPQEPGDTLVTSWQIMVLKTGHFGYLQVAPQTARGAITFLDSVQSEEGAFYGYMSRGKRPDTTASALLCRVYLGAKHEDAALQKGVSYLANIGPSNEDMLYNYYATQVMMQYGGEMWEAWNRKMRDFLIEEQEKDGHAQGSWYFSGAGGGVKGGRLYDTALATMILEVYYRHLPIYGKGSN